MYVYKINIHIWSVQLTRAPYRYISALYQNDEYVNVMQHIPALIVVPLTHAVLYSLVLNRNTAIGNIVYDTEQCNI